MELTDEQKEMMSQIANLESANLAVLLEHKLQVNIKLEYSKPGELSNLKLIIPMPNKDIQINDGLASLVSYLNMLSQLEKDGFIYVYNASNIPPRGDMVIELADEMPIENQAEVPITDKNVVKMVPYFLQEIRPTVKLTKLVENGFKTSEEIISSKTYWATIIGAIAAVIAAIAAVITIFK